MSDTTKKVTDLSPVEYAELLAVAWDRGFGDGLNEDVRVANGHEPAQNPYRAS